MSDRWEFSHAESGMTRFPPNVEQISVEREATRTWLVARRNDVVLRFPLTEEDCRHLARLLFPVEGKQNANASLIAAAPDLYEALAAFVRYGDGHDDFEDLWPAARAALAKVRGNV